ncbi:hypothetical protein ACF0H5_011542 [Mactra antiquata]
MRVCRRFIRNIFLMSIPSLFFMLLTELYRATYKHVNTELTEVQREVQNRFTAKHNGVLEEPKAQYPPYLKLLHGEAYLYSGIFISHHLNKQDQNEIVVNGWERKTFEDKSTVCCILLKNEKTILRVTHIKKLHWFLQSKLHATQFRCPTKADYSNILGVTIAYTNTCTKNSSQYITLTLVGDAKEKHVGASSGNEIHYNSSRIGICAKLAYGNLDARRLVEWFEVHRLFGVDMIVAYSYNLNSKARKVFSYYEKLGISKLYEFDIPEKDEVSRDVGVKNVQSWNDEQIALYDCQERLYFYDYVAVVDTDEFLIPKTDNFSNAWKKFFEKQFQRRLLSAILFKIQIHVTTWDKRNHPLFIGQYTNGTKPMYDRVKEVYMPSRIKSGTVSTHSLKPLPKYSRTYANPRLATIHHFRTCRKEWLKSDKNVTKDMKNKKSSNGNNQTSKCDTLEKHHCPEVEKLANVVKDQVVQAMKNIGVTITYTNTCTKNSSQYITITLEGDGREKRVEDRSDNERHYNSTHIGICAKVAYGNLDARRLVEWFEVHRLFGVDMIIAYSYNLNSQARKVFSYYEKLGISKLFDFDIPEKDDVKRDVGVKKAQSWSDEQVALYDYQERLYHYDYVAVVDTDEFLVPKTNNFSNAWKEFFERKFQRRLLSAIMFKVQIHVTTWDKRNHPLFIGQYTNGTKPMHDRIKQVYMPSRIKPGTVFTHGLRPLRNYTKKFANSAEATIHHFRLCRKAWLKEIHTPETNTSSSGPNKTNKCNMFKKRHCPEVETLANVVQDQVLIALKNIGLQVV